MLQFEKEDYCHYTQIPADRAKKIEAAKNVFGNIIKQMPPESYKKIQN